MEVTIAKKSPGLVPLMCSKEEVSPPNSSFDVKFFGVGKGTCPLVIQDGL